MDSELDAGLWDGATASFSNGFLVPFSEVVTTWKGVDIVRVNGRFAKGAPSASVLSLELRSWKDRVRTKGDDLFDGSMCCWV